ncbi:MAG: FtsX-like permease family protein [Betaproteobacteria bacterium]|nr:FtsX-like permease family protein [Betaproteobacteria bacterium]
MNAYGLSWRMLRRHFKLMETRVLFAALTLAVMSVTTVGFFADRVDAALKRQAGELIAADAVVIADKPVKDRFRDEAARLGLTRSESATFPSMVSGDAAKGQGVNLAEIKAVDANFPLRGKLRIADTPGGPARDADGPPAPGTAWVPETLLVRLNAQVGDEIRLGAARLKLTHVLVKEPDSVLDYFGIAPRVLMNRADLPRTGLIQTGSRVTYRLLVAGEPAEVEAFRAAFRGKMERGERLESVKDARSEVRVALERSERFLGLAAMLTVILASVAVALAARRFSERQLDSAAMMRCLGASQADIFRLHFLQFLMLGLGAAVLGTLLGAIAQAGLAQALSKFFTVALPYPSLLPALQGLAVGLALVMGFTVPPLLALRRVPTLRVIRRDLNPFDAGASIAYLLGFATLAALIIWRAGDVKLGGIAVGGFVGAMVVTGITGALLIEAAAASRGAAGRFWRVGLANLKRRRAASLTQVMALGLGLMAMLMLTIVRSDMIERWQDTLKLDVPNRFVINVQKDQVEPVRAYFKGHGLEMPDLYPMVRGRLMEINGQPLARKLEGEKDERTKRLGEREFNLTWLARQQADNKLVAGRFWLPEERTPQFSVEEGIAKAMNIKVGDTMTYDIGGTRITHPVTSIRSVKWESFRPNFFVAATPGTLDEFPASYISSFRLPPDNEKVVSDLIRTYPNLSVIDMSAIMNQVKTISEQVAGAVSFVFLFALFAGVVVLYAAIASTQDERLYDAAVMRTLGARRGQIRAMQAAEFVAIGALAGGVASLGALAVSALIAERVINVPYEMNAWIPLIGVGLGGLGIALAGLIGTRKALDAPPLATIRGLA